MRNVTELQQRLISFGYPVGPSGADGRFGHDTLDAYNRFRASKGKPPVDFASMAQLNADLFPEEQPAPPPKKPSLIEMLALIRDGHSFLKGKPMNSSWLTSFVGTTAFKYLVAMLATYVAGKLGLDPVEGKATIEGVLSQLIGVAMGIWGMWESSRNKIVLDGQKVSVSDLDAADTKAVKEIVATNK